jgi:uncharacterized protein
VILAASSAWSALCAAHSDTCTAQARGYSAAPDMRGLLFLALFSYFGHRVLLLWLKLIGSRYRIESRKANVLAAAAALVPVVVKLLAQATHAAVLQFLCELLAVEVFIVAFSAPIVLLASYLLKRRAEKLMPIALPAGASPTDASVLPVVALAATAENREGEALSDPALPRRQLMQLAGTGLASYSGFGFLLVYGDRKSRFDFAVEELVVKIPKLSKKLEGYTIVQVSDIHTGVFIREQELKRGFDIAASLRPDLVVATGDLVDADSSEAPLFARMFANIPSRDGHYCILGNHDHYSNAEAVESLLRKSDVRVLVNEAVRIRGAEGGIDLVGVDDLHGLKNHRGPDYWKAVAKLPNDAPRILLAHQPRYVDWVKGHPDLQLSGHTHGGQINVGVRPADLIMRYVAGRYQVGGTTLWVNRGFGTTGPPVRLGAPPEITKIVLVSG